MHALDLSGMPLPSWANVEDTMILHHLHASNEYHALKGIGARMLGGWAYEGQDQLKALMQATGTDWATVPVDAPEYWAYGVLDTCLTRLVWDAPEMQATLARDRAAYEQEMAYRDIMWRAERRGMYVDTTYARNLIEGQYNPRIEELFTYLTDAGIANPNSNRQVEAALAALGWEAEEWTPTGDAKLDKAVLHKVQELGDATGQIASHLIEYKRLVGWRDKYLAKFAASGGVMHPSVRTLGARTGRSSVTDPPLQQIPSRDGKEIRDCVIAPDGRSIVAIDYSNQESRLFAHYSQDPGLLEVFANGEDFHQAVANRIGVSRPVAKTINFALIYGAGPAKMAEQAGVTEKEMRGFLGQYHEQYPGVSEFMRTVEGVAKGRAPLPYVTTGGGRRSYCMPGEEYKLVNYLVQGTGADVLKEAAIRLDKAGLGDDIMLPVHDELVFYFPTDEAEERTRTAVELMRDETYDVPLDVDASDVVERWGDAK